MSRLLAVVLAVPLLSGCAGLHNTCRYGVAAHSTGNSCRSRPRPSDEQVRAAMDGSALTKALAAWKARPKSATVNGVGVNWWGETTFTVRTALNGPHEYTLTTYDRDGKPASGDEEYVSGHGDSFSVGAVHPDAVAKAVAAIRAKQPEIRMLTASLTVAPFIDRVAWSIQVVSPDADSALVYQVAPGGGGLCHGKDALPDDKLVPAPGIPACPNPVFAND